MGVDYEIVEFNVIPVKADQLVEPAVIVASDAIIQQTEKGWEMAAVDDRYDFEELTADYGSDGRPELMDRALFDCYLVKVGFVGEAQDYGRLTFPELHGTIENEVRNISGLVDVFGKFSAEILSEASLQMSRYPSSASVSFLALFRANSHQSGDSGEWDTLIEFAGILDPARLCRALYTQTETAQYKE